MGFEVESLKLLLRLTAVMSTTVGIANDGSEGDMSAFCRLGLSIKLNSSTLRPLRQPVNPAVYTKQRFKSKDTFCIHVSCYSITV